MKKLMISQVLKLLEMCIIGTYFITFNSTPVNTNTHQNNPKILCKNKSSKNNQPRYDKGCTLGAHTATNQVNELNYEFYFG